MFHSLLLSIFFLLVISNKAIASKVEMNYFLKGYEYERLLIYPNPNLDYPYLELFKEKSLSGEPYIKINSKGVFIDNHQVCVENKRKFTSMFNNQSIIYQELLPADRLKEKIYRDPYFLSRQVGLEEEFGSLPIHCDRFSSDYFAVDDSVFPPIGKCYFVRDFLYRPNYCSSRISYYELLLKSINKKGIAEINTPYSYGILYADVSNLIKRKNVVYIPKELELRKNVFKTYPFVKKEIDSFVECTKSNYSKSNCLKKYLKNKNEFNYLLEHGNESIKKFHDNFDNCYEFAEGEINECLEKASHANNFINCYKNLLKKYKLGVDGELSAAKITNKLNNVKLRNLCLNSSLDNKVKNKKINKEVIRSFQKIYEGRLFYNINHVTEVYPKNVKDFVNGSICLRRNSMNPRELSYKDSICNHNKNNEFNFSLCVEIENRKFKATSLDIECSSSPQFFKDNFIKPNNRVTSNGP